MCGQFWSHALTHARYLVGSDGSHLREEEGACDLGTGTEVAS